MRCRKDIFRPVYGGVSDESYVHPAEAYTWKVIAHNDDNLDCADPATAQCDGDDYGLWSTALTATQESATPGVIATPGFGTITQTSIELTWNAPEDHVASVSGDIASYRVTCKDAQGAYAYTDWDDERATDSSPLENTFTAAQLFKARQTRVLVARLSNLRVVIFALLDVLSGHLIQAILLFEPLPRFAAHENGHDRHRRCGCKPVKGHPFHTV